MRWYKFYNFSPLLWKIIIVSDGENFELRQSIINSNRSHKYAKFLCIPLNDCICDYFDNYPKTLIKNEIYWCYLPEIPKIHRSIPAHIRLKILKRDKYTCKLCGLSPAKNNNIELEIDHIYPFSLSKEHKEYNLQVLCKKCNRTKADKY